MAIANLTASHAIRPWFCLPDLFDHLATNAGLMAITQMAAGDGFADIVGRRWGKVFDARTLLAGRIDKAELISLLGRSGSAGRLEGS